MRLCRRLGILELYRLWISSIMCWKYSEIWEKGHSRTVEFTGQGMSFLLIWKCSIDKVMILRDIKTDRNDIYLIYCYLFWFLHSRGETP